MHFVNLELMSSIMEILGPTICEEAKGNPKKLDVK